ncbi:MAG: diphthine--ammonia ligase [Halodesulfurarchaeum sp.]
MGAEQWVSLYSGGKDSAAALQRARDAGLSIDRLVTVHPPDGSYLYHVPATNLTALASLSIGVGLTAVEGEASPGHDSTVRGDQELEPLEETLKDLQSEIDGGLAGVTVGAIESDYQADRIADMCRRLGIDMYAPLWRRDPMELGEWLLERGFQVRIVSVAAAGLEESWLGRELDATALDELAALNEERGVHVLGEGGEYETLVTDGPHMARPIEIEYHTEWMGDRGHLVIESAELGDA